MNSSDFRKEAREKLSGKWGKAALITFIYFCIALILNTISQKFIESSISIIINILICVITIPIAYGLIDTFIKLFNNENVSTFDFISTGFNNFSRSWKIILNTLLKLLLPLVLLIVSIIIIITGGVGTIGFGLIQNSNKVIESFGGILIIGSILYIVSIVLLILWSYYYQLSQIIAIENPDLTAKEAVDKSKEYMTGNRWKLFCLEFSFIGWAILAAFTLGIGYFWLFPYMQVATIAFSRYVCSKKEDTTTQTENIENIDNN